jgi:hypothetical protein
MLRKATDTSGRELTLQRATVQMKFGTISTGSRCYDPGIVPLSLLHHHAQAKMKVIKRIWRAHHLQEAPLPLGGALITSGLG